MTTPHYYVGMMSGTSLDGIDACLLQIASDGKMTISAPYQLHMPPVLQAQFRTLHHATQNELHRSAQSATELANLYAQACQRLLIREGIEAPSIRAIGAHGQTIRHQPHSGYSIQLLNASVLAEQTQINVVYDFRARDIAAGGQGAPLIPAFHQALAQSMNHYSWAFLNLGGMGNLTLGWQDCVLGADTGPANVLLDAWFKRHHPEKNYDDAGAWANSGKVYPPLLQTLSAHPFFAQALPKSCGYEEFNLAWLDAQLQSHPDFLQLKAEDVQATLTELSAFGIESTMRLLLNQQATFESLEKKNAFRPSADSTSKPFQSDFITAHQSSTIANKPENLQTLWVFGGGVHNRALMSAISQRLPELALISSATLGIHPQSMEAGAFAYFAHCYCANIPANIPSVTGAHNKRILGAMVKA